MAKKKTKSKPNMGRLKQAVPPKTYETWVRMLKLLVPHGRTQRLAVVVAGMLQHAAHQGKRGGKITELLVDAEDDGPYGKSAAAVTRLVEGLFKDARVKWKRTSARGERYSIAEEAVREFFAWYNMPWEE
jgi:hypothetical protein